MYKKISNWCEKIICVGYNSIGKTYSVENGIVNNYLKKNKRCVWIRNTSEEAQKCVAGWNDALLRNGIKDFKITRHGVFLKDKKDKKGKKWFLMIPFIYLSSPDSSIPQFDNVEIYGWDEVIPSNDNRAFTIPSVRKVLEKLTNRTGRGGKFGWLEKDKKPFFFLSNLNSLESDFFSQSGIDIDYELLYKGIPQIQVEKDKKRLVMIWPKDFNIKQTEGQRAYWNHFWTDEDDLYPIPHPSLKRIYPFRTTNCELLYNITYLEKDNQYSVLKCVRNGKDYLRVDKMRKCDFDKTNYCFNISDKNENNILIYPNEAMQYVRELFEYKLNYDRIEYDCPNTRQDMDLLLDFLQDANIKKDK